MKLLYVISVAVFLFASAFILFGDDQNIFFRHLPANEDPVKHFKKDAVKNNVAKIPAGKKAISQKKEKPVPFYLDFQTNIELVPGPLLSAIKTVDKATAAPGETLTYTVTISNTGTGSAEDLEFSDDIDANTTLIANSLQTSPIAANDNYSSLGNVGIVVPAVNGILANDYLGTNPLAALTPVVDAATTGGGTISIAADGSFTYVPAAGFTGDDTYQYSLTNTAGSDNGTVTITVANITWFINNNYAGTIADGRLGTPFKSIGDFQAVNDGAGLHPGDNHVIFIYESATAYTGNLSLRNGQKLIGQDATTTLPAITGYTTPLYSSPALPTLNSANATIVTLNSIAASTPIINLNGGVSATYTIRGLSIGDNPNDAASAGIAGTSFGTLNTSEVSISGTGQALLLNTGTLAATFVSVSSTSGTNGISLTTINGILTINGGSLAGNGTGVNLNGGTASVTYNGTISNSSTLLVNIQSKTGGTVDFNGLISSGAGARGISLANNTGATIRFDGGLTLNTGANNAFSASGGGTLNITQDNTAIINTIVTTSGIGLQVANTTIGANGASFRSIAVNGASKGISLNTTGAGAFNITGQGTTATSGGTIQNISVRGIELISAQNISLNNIQLTNANTTDGGGAGVCDEVNNIGCNAALYLKDVTTVALTQVNITTTEEQGMNMNNVNGLTISNCAVQGNGNAAEEGALKIRNLLGTSSISNSIFKNSAYRISHIINTTGTAHLTVSNSSFINEASNLSLIKQDCFEMRTQSTANATLLINNSVFKRAGTKGIQVFAENTSTINMAITGSSIDKEGQLMAGVEVGSDQTAVMNANVDNNTLITGAKEVPLNVYSGSTSTMQSTARNNIIQGGNNPDQNAFATLRGFADQSSNSKVLFTGNTITQTDLQGILVASAGSVTGGSISGQVGSNNINTQNIGTNLTLSGIEVSSFSGGAGANTNCSYVNGNAVTMVAGTRHFRVAAGSATSVIQLQGPASASTAELWNNNSNTPASPPAVIIADQIGGSTVTNGGVFVCPLPTNTTLPTAVAKITPLEEENLLSSEAGYNAKTSQTGEEEIIKFTSGEEKPAQLNVSNETQNIQTANELLSGENVSVSGITLPENETLVIKFQVTVNDPFPGNVCDVSNQGEVSGTNFTTLLTDNDADANNGIQPTVTVIPVAPAITGCQSNINVNTDQGSCTSSQAFSVTFTGCPEPTVTYTIKNTATIITSPYAFPAGTTTVVATVGNGVGTDATCEFTVTVNSPAPVVSSVSVPANGWYIAGQNLDFTVNFDAAVTVSGTPYIPLTIGAQSMNASYLSGSGTSALVFRYTVASTDYDDNGISVGASIDANGGTIENVCGDDANLVLNGVGSTTLVLVDGVVPTVTINQADGQADPTSNTTIHFTAVFSEPVTGFVSTDITPGGTAGATTAIVSETAPNDGTTYNIAISGMTGDGTVTASINAGVASDAAGNLNAASTSTDNTVTFVADAPPFVASINRHDPLSAITNADAVTFRVTFSEDVTGVDVTDLTLTTTATASGSIASVTLVNGATYDVLVNSVSGDGTLRLDLNASGTGIKDNIDQDITGGFTTGQLYTIDNTAPLISNCPTEVSVSAGLNCTAVASWTEPTANDNIDGAVVYFSRSHAPGDIFNAGTTQVTYTFKDVADNESTCSFNVNVTDNTDPEFTTPLSAEPSVLWPPDHKMKDIELTYQVSDNCGCTPVITVTSNESPHGTGDGDKAPDWEIIDANHIKLRAERGNGRDARVYTIKVTCTDIAGNDVEDVTYVRIAHNVTNPVSGTSFKIGSTVNFAGEFWDIAGNKHTGSWLIDESTTAKGTVTEPSGNKNGKLTGSYKFSSAGVYKLQMNLTDQNRLTSYANTNDDMEAIVVIYDPNGGYAHGGGWFNSPAGALVSDPTATGKVSYGFTANYFKTATYPKGETQFEFKVGEFEFNALNFEYLVVDGAKAQFKGTGKITGDQSGINFIMTVIDGQLDGTGVDKIRMKIYNKNNGFVYFDNQPDLSDADSPSHPVAGESTIVIGGSDLSSGGGGGGGKPKRTLATITLTQEESVLNATVHPNPSRSNFRLKISSSNKTDLITMQVFDSFGRPLEIKRVNAGETVLFGEAYRPGSYFVRLLQAGKQKEIKLIKLAD